MADDVRRRWSLSRLGIRSRTTIAAVVVVGIVLVVGAIALVTLTRNRIETSIQEERSPEQRAWQRWSKPEG
jgi:hypothetical protein